MKKLIFSILLLCLSASPALAETAYDRVMETGVLRCGFLTWPPMQYEDLNTGEMAGPISDYAAALSEALDFELVWAEELNLSTYLADLNAGRYDVECAGGWPTPERAKRVTYLTPVFFVPYYIYVRGDDDRFNEIAALNADGVTMAIMDGENTSQLRDRMFGNTQTVEIPGNGQVSDLILSVTTGKADFTALDTLSAHQFLENNPGEIKPIGAPVHMIPISLSVAQGETALKEMLETTTNLLLYNGEIDRILDKYDPDREFYKRRQPAFEE